MFARPKTVKPDALARLVEAQGKLPEIKMEEVSDVREFTDGTRVVPLAIGQGGTLYLSAYTNTSTRLLRGVWDGARWAWQEIELE